MRVQGIYIYGLKCHNFNTLDKQVDVHVYILKASHAAVQKLLQLFLYSLATFSIERCLQLQFMQHLNKTSFTSLNVYL